MDNYDDFKSGIPRCDQIPFSSPLECKLLFQFCFNLSMTRTYEYHCVFIKVLIFVQLYILY